jgi:aspartate aminotransferase-like enzyme/GNAT superfamily N-acetyltransferase
VSGTRELRFKVAAASEFEQIFRLGYETFIEEIPQYPPNPEHRHVDRFHAENTYLVAMADDTVVGMIAVRDRRPFSLDEKLGNVDAYLPPGRSVCELRLLAVRREYRKGWVFRGLVDLLLEHGLARGWDLAIISGTVRQTKLYRHLGFVPFGPLVGSAEAPFQPMYITIEGFEMAAPELAAPHREAVSFLPGPVTLAPEVRAAFERLPVSHRNGEFREEFDRTKARLCRLVGAPHVEILLGSGTLANDVVAAQLSLQDGPGVVVSNGEFGERLIDHARRMRLPYTAVAFGWGERFDGGRITEAVEAARADWLWAVASETSTGMLNDLGMLRSIARRHDLALCLDCVSAIGAVPLDLPGVDFVTGASGKALAALPGLSFVFHAHQVAPEPTRLPRYLDLGYYAEKGGIPFTHSSNLIAALDAALDRFATDEPFAYVDGLSRWLRPRLCALGLPILVDGPDASPAVITIPFGDDCSATATGDALQRLGLLVAYQSEYLVRRNWLQIGLMGHCTRQHLERLLDALARAIGAGSTPGRGLSLVSEHGSGPVARTPSLGTAAGG